MQPETYTTDSTMQSDRQVWASFRSWRSWAAVALVAVACFLGATLSVSRLNLATEASPLWLPSGVALAALLGLGRYAWIGIVLGIFWFNSASGVPLPVSLGSVMGTTLEAVVAAYLLRRVRFQATLQRVKDVLWFVLMAVTLSPVINAIVGSLNACWLGYVRWDRFASNAWTVWLGDGIGILVFTPLLLTLRCRRSRLGPEQPTLLAHLRTRPLLEELIWLGLLVAVSGAVFYSHFNETIAHYPLEYLPFPLVIWAALRFGQPGAVLASCLLSIIAIAGTVANEGPFFSKASSTSQMVLLLQAFIGVITFTAMFLAAAMAERDHTEALLRQSESSLANAQRLARLGNWDFDFIKQRWCWSDQLYCLLGFCKTSCAPHPEAFLRAVHPHDRQRVQQAFSQAVLHREPYRIEYRILRPDGAERVVEELVEISANKATATVQDITERKQAEEHLRVTAERNRLLSEVALRIHRSLDLNEILETTVREIRQFLHADRVFISRFDELGKGRVVAESVIPGWESALGWTTEPAIYPEIQKIFVQHQIRVVNNTEQIDPSPFLQDYYDRFQIKAGIGVPIVLDASSRLYGALIVNQCAAPRQWQPEEIQLLEQLGTQVAIAIQQAELYRRVQLLNSTLEQQVTERTFQLQQNMAELEELNQLREVFLHAIAHDLRTTVMGNVMVLKSMQSQPGEAVSVSRSLLDRMIQSCEVQLGKLNSLLEAYSNKTEGVQLNCQPTCLKAVLNAALADLQGLFEQNQVQLENQIPDHLPLVQADAAHLQRVLSHLLTNAVKHNPPDVKITLQADIEDGMLYCTVNDNGRGLAPAQQERLFDLRVRSAQDRQLMGISLGLYLCHQIITAHGGTIGVVSQPGQGSSFWFTLPVAAEAACQKLPR